ncbi:MAG: site-specific DNA-methyltransferase [Saprospiraceae bacterium]
MKNRFNRLTSKEWLPFQKSWFRYASDARLIEDHFRFFCKAESEDSYVLYFGDQFELASEIASRNEIKIIRFEQFNSQTLQYIFLDLRHLICGELSVLDYLNHREKVLDMLASLFSSAEHRRFLTILMPNLVTSHGYFPFAWDMALQVKSIFSLKDEKIACKPLENADLGHEGFFYVLNFRKDEFSMGQYKEHHHSLFSNNISNTNKKLNAEILPWFILKPIPRKKNEILHPAKYPEELVVMFIKRYTNKDENVFDPMSGTGSTQVASLKLGRNAYGTELSEYFAEIAESRCRQVVLPTQNDLFTPPVLQQYRILNIDARMLKNGDFPEIDFMITSPPYWDMLNMKGAENQAKRIEKGLQTNYSDDASDLGNIADYETFIDELTDVYLNLIEVMKDGSFVTIIVKNIKKKGKNYPFAWDLANRLMTHLVLLPEVFWCQDDINLAPYGYGNTFVSNTFHQYCLTFQKPLK